MATFTTKPVEGQDPWAATDLAWRSSVESAVNGVEATANAALPVKGALGGVDLNTVITPGVYRRETGTGGANFPVSDAGICEVFQTVGSAVMQRFTPHSVLPARGRGFYLRGVTSGEFSEWRFIPSQRVDQTAGRAIYTWDNVNGREQRIYGDTGMRDIRTSLGTGWTAGQLLLTRTNNTVSILIQGLTPGETPATQFLVGLASGFRPWGNHRWVVATGSAATGYLNYNSSNNSLEIAASGAVFSAPIEVSWVTYDAWPTTLPGVASGSIPNA